MKWTKERVLEISKNFKTRKEFKAAYPSAVAHAYNHGYKEEAFGHLKKAGLSWRNPIKPGTKYGRLTFKQDLGLMKAQENSSSKTRFGHFLCDCGNPTLQRIAVSKVKRGETQSCGECRYFENPKNYGRARSQCLICGKPIKTTKNRIAQGKSKVCSRECMYEWRKLKAVSAHIGFKHEKAQLKVIEFKVDKSNDKEAQNSYTILAKCECDCGKLHDATWKEVRLGECLRCTDCQESYRQKIVDSYEGIKGMRYGRLVVSGFRFAKGPNNINGYFACDCDCGTKDHKVDSLNLLKESYITSCGCLENKDKDTYRAFKGNKEHRERRCEVYFVETSKAEQFMFGISENSEAHLRENGGYRKIHRINKDLNRAKCWCIAQILLNETLNQSSKSITGQEVRIGLDIHNWSKRFDQLVEEASSTGWRALYDKYITSKK